MSMTSLISQIDDQYLPELQQKAMQRQDEGLQKMVPRVQGKYFDQAAIWKDEDGFGVNPMRYFGEDARRHGVYPEQDELKYWETYWLQKLKVNRIFNEPIRERKVRQFAADWWACMKIFEHEKAAAWPEQPAATVQKAFTTSTLQSVFPIFFESNIQAGILADPVIDRLVADTVPTNSMNATHLTMTDTEGDSLLGEAGEGTSFVQLTIKHAERTVKLRKFGGELLATYEALMLARLPVLARALERIGQRYQQLITDFALSTLIDGDGAGDGAITDVAAAATVYESVVNLVTDFPQGYSPDTILLPVESVRDLYNATEWKDPLAGTPPQVNGLVPRPMGLEPVRWDVTGRVSTYEATNVVVFDSDKALIRYTLGGVMTESERVIKSQWERSVTSEWTGFAIWDREAARRGTGW